MLGKEQYATSDKYEARINLNAEFSTSKESKFRWIFSYFPKKDSIKILELGCGTGLFWLANRHDIPADWSITLTDYSRGMLVKTKAILTGIKRDFRYEVMAAEDIKYPAGHFDLIFANNMLYHVEKRSEAISSIADVLKDDGVFIVSTMGKNDMKELNRILYDFLADKNNTFRFRDLPFSLDNGAAQLALSFPNVNIELFKNSLEINRAEPIIDYYLSYNGMYDGINILRNEDISLFRLFLNNLMKTRKVIKVTKESGMFICKKKNLIH